VRKEAGKERKEEEPMASSPLLLPFSFTCERAHKPAQPVSAYGCG
jgi:hypothetical protein